MTPVPVNDSDLHQCLARINAVPGRRIAVFDADGTLWRADSGDGFFAYQRRLNLMRNAPTQGDALLKIYEEKVAQGRTREAFSDMALWNAGATEAELIAWSKDFWKKEGRALCPIIESQRQLIDKLKRAGVEVWVISASLWWVVVEGVKELGIPADRVIAARTKPGDGGKGPLTEEWLYPFPYREGKTAVIHEKIGLRPHLVAGNSMGDWAMMALAQELVLVVNSAGLDDPYYATEQELLALAQPRAQQAGSKPRWLIQKHR